MMLDAALFLGPSSKDLRCGLAVATKIDSRRLLRLVAAILCLLSIFASPAEAKTGTTASTKPSQQVSKSTKSGKLHRAKSKRRGSWKKRGQKDIDDQRCRAIQEALV